MRLAAVITLIAASASAMSPGSVEYAARWIGERVGATLRDNLSVEWLFASDASDSSGNGRDGTITPPSSVVSAYLKQTPTGRVATANFDYNRGGFSVAAWVQLTNAATLRMIASQYLTTGNQRSWFLSSGDTSVLSGVDSYDWQVTIISDGAINNATNSVSMATTASDIRAKTHVAFTFDAGNLKLYEDGSLAANTYTNYSAPITSAYVITESIAVGCVNPSAGGVNHFGGPIDSFKMWDRVLTPGEISQLYLEGSDIP